MDIWVLGCGPSLREVCIPPDVFTIGTNNSYKQHWSPIWAGTDIRALRRDYQEIEVHNRPLMWFSAIDPDRIKLDREPGKPLEFIQRPERPSLRKAGVFAYWVACHVFRASRVHLIGFDMEAAPVHFDDGKQSDWSYESQRFQMLEIQRKYDVETWIWLTGDEIFYPLKALPCKSVRVAADGSVVNFGAERDITQGVQLPQEFSMPGQQIKLRRKIKKTDDPTPFASRFEAFFDEDTNGENANG